MRFILATTERHTRKPRASVDGRSQRPKSAIRRVVAKTRWQLVTFYGRGGGESVGVVDMLAIRKDHRAPQSGMKRGDAFHIILIQVKGGGAAMPTAKDGRRLRAVAKRHGAEQSPLGVWKVGKEVRFFSLQPSHPLRDDWMEVDDLDAVFG